MRQTIGFGIGGVFAICVGITAVLPAEPGPRDAAAICARSPCRTAIDEFRLTDAQGGTFILNTAPVPYVDEGRITLFAGETIEAAFPEGGVDMPRFVRAAGPLQPGAPGRLAVQLVQDAGKADMSLALQSTLDVPLAFDAVLFVPTPNAMGQRRISSCVALPNGVTRKTWPYPVATMVLSNFRAAEAGSNPADCR